ncbi:MAG: HlyD family efflux transporter periplasmic adaptor subunit, partial [Methylocystaceae bacterium]
NSRRQQRISQEKRKKQAGGLAILLAALFLVFCLSHGLIRVIKVGIVRSSLEYKTAAVEEVVAGVKVKGLVIRPEQVLPAPVSGRFENVVLNEARVRQGSVIGQLYPTGGGAPHAIKAPTTGMVVFGVDGLESAFEGFKFLSCSPEALEYQANFRSLAGEEVKAGQPLLKIVDNLAPLKIVVGFKLSDFAEPWESGKKVEIICGSRNFRAEVTELKGSGDQGMALLTLPGDDFLGRLRTASFTLVEFKAQGVTVPRSSLVHYGTGLGVYILANEKPKAVSVKIECQNDKKAVVDGLAAGELIVTNPEHIKDAKPLFTR